MYRFIERINNTLITINLYTGKSVHIVGILNCLSFTSCHDFMALVGSIRLSVLYFDPDYGLGYHIITFLEPFARFIFQHANYFVHGSQLF